MRKISIELPKYRLQMHVKLVKRRKSLLDKTLIPSPSVVKRKYRKGSYPGRLVRYFTDHKSIRKIFAASFTLVAGIIILFPQSSIIQAQGDENIVIESQTNLVTEKAMVYPVEQVKINQNYGVFHKGIDLGGNLQTQIKPIMPGFVAYSGWDRSGYGNLVILQHKNGIESYYAHLSKIEVKTGDHVTTDTEIGKMGATGHATGVHLHLEIHQNGVSLNPLTVLSK